MKRVSLFILIGSAISGGVAHAATYYVSKSGSNSNSCAQAKSISTPKLTVAGGLGCLVAGDTLLVRGGTYDDRINNLPSGTSWSNKVRVAAYPGETVWLNPPNTGTIDFAEAIRLEGSYRYIEFDGLNIDARTAGGTGITIRYSDPTHEPDHIRVQNATIYVTTNGAGLAPTGPFGIMAGTWVNGVGGFHEFINLRIDGGGRHGGAECENSNNCQGYSIYLATSNALVENCDFTNATGYLLHIYAGTPPKGNIIRNNRFHNLHYAYGRNPAAIEVVGSDHQIYNNLIYDIDGGGGSGSGIHIYGGSGTNNQIYSNTIYKVGRYGIDIDASSSGGNIIRNNIVWAAGGGGVFNGSGNSNTCDHNLLTSTVNITCTNNLSADPLFMDASNLDFHLQSGSPARGAGTLGTDMGAFEYSAQASPPPAPLGLHIVAN